MNEKIEIVSSGLKYNRKNIIPKIIIDLEIISAIGSRTWLVNLWVSFVIIDINELSLVAKKLEYFSFIK